MSDEEKKKLRRIRNRRHYKRQTKGIMVIPVPERPEVIESFLGLKVLTDAQSLDRQAMGEEISHFHRFMIRQWGFAHLAQQYVEHRAGTAIVSTVNAISATVSNIFRTRPNTRS